MTRTFQVFQLNVGKRAEVQKSVINNKRLYDFACGKIDDREQGVNKSLEAEQVPVLSPDITAVRVRLKGLDVLVVSVYVHDQDDRALSGAC
ncbi:hypothetical protein CI238_11358 [Colletotrichum incanum]|uniref:Uncharacterized protein n=1 Tax=Colletotrichum incanum TaxID=1573173 RepID=A0A161W172_COLIC|nr:hypothetical protein CI238_11358 [Colletotrichum incanum]